MSYKSVLGKNYDKEFFFKTSSPFIFCSSFLLARIYTKTLTKMMTMTMTMVPMVVIIIMLINMMMMMTIMMMVITMLIMMIMTIMMMVTIMMMITMVSSGGSSRSGPRPHASSIFTIDQKLMRKKGFILIKNDQGVFYRFIVMTELPSAVSSSISCEEQR